MSRGRRKKNSTLLASSTRTSSRRWLRCRYPASLSICDAGSDSPPLLGPAIRSLVLLTCGGRRLRGCARGRVAQLGGGRATAKLLRQFAHLIHIQLPSTLRQLLPLFSCLLHGRQHLVASRSRTLLGGCVASQLTRQTALRTSSRPLSLEGVQ